MTEAQKQFEAWYDDGVNEPLPTDYTILGKRYLYMGYTAAWQHQQQRIDELEKKLSEIDKDNERLNFLDSLQDRATSDMKINMSLKSDIHINGSLGVSLYIRNYKGHTESTAYGKTIRETIDMALKQIEVK